MESIVLKTIQTPEDGPWVHLIDAGPGRGLVTGRGAMRMTCGNWSAVLAEDMEGEHQLTDTVLKCSSALVAAR
jgi:hypothetical protein